MSVGAVLAAIGSIASLALQGAQTIGIEGNSYRNAKISQAASKIMNELNNENANLSSLLSQVNSLIADISQYAGATSSGPFAEALNAAKHMRQNQVKNLEQKINTNNAKISDVQNRANSLIADTSTKSGLDQVANAKQYTPKYYEEVLRGNREHKPVGSAHASPLIGSGIGNKIK